MSLFSPMASLPPLRALTAAPRIHAEGCCGGNGWAARSGPVSIGFSPGPALRSPSAVGETVVEVTGSGSGGRNTHAALLAAQRLAGTDDLFASFATDGVDGESGCAGAIVDGTTIERGGDPGPALADFDSAGYLARTGDLLVCSPTGTNVADLWILWRRAPAAT